MLMLVEAIIRPQKVADVKAALAAIGVKGLTVTEALGAGNERGYSHTYRGAEYAMTLVQRIKIEVAVLDREARVVADAIMNAARTGQVGDGKIFLIPIADAQRIRTGEEGRDAIE
jgi:nitrogen regulatory protein P-II 1